jgi:exonuclease SbcC
VRPLYLKFSGLNSYSSAAEVDFSLLQKDRIFGVFGETGAGKSTIIDAITFALFGKIDRVGAEVKASINPLAKKIDVQFDFQMGSNRYRAVRTASARKSEAYLYRLHDGDAEPIADKARDVNDTITKLVGGFDYQEFTKVIALPQNKFGEFLSAEPAKRAALLEKIFDLGKYGEELWRRVSEEETLIDSQVKAIALALEQLAEVSVENLREKERQKAKTGTELGLGKKQLQKKEKELQELRELARLLRESERIETAKKRLHAKEPEMTGYKERLEKGAQARPFKGDVENVDIWKREIEGLATAIAGLQSQHTRAESDLQSLTETRRQMEKKKADRLPGIAIEMRKAEEAIELANTLKTLKQKEKNLKKEMGDVRAGIESTDLGLKELSIKKAGYEQKREALNTQKESLQLSEEEEALQDALGAAEKAEGALTHINESLDRERERLRTLSAESESKKKIIRTTWDGLLSGITLQDPERADETLNAEKSSAEMTLRLLKDSLHREELRNQASVLAGVLADGEPCPVCGSFQHPAPATGDTAGMLGLICNDVQCQEEFLETIRKSEKVVMPLVREAQKCLAGLETTKKSISDLEGNRKRVGDEIMTATGLPVKEATEKRTFFQERQKQAGKVAREMDLILKELESCNEAFARTVNVLNDLHLRETAVSGELKQHGASIIEKEQKIGALVGKNIPATLLKSLEGEQKQIADQAAVLTKKVESTEKCVKDLKERLDTSLGRKGEIEKKLLAATGKLKDATERFGITEEELRAWILEEEEVKRFQALIDKHYQALKEVEGQQKQIEKRRSELEVQQLEEGDLEETEKAVEETKEMISNLSQAMGALLAEIEGITRNLNRKDGLVRTQEEREKERKTVQILRDVLRGKDFVHFIVKQLGGNIIRLASESFYSLTGERMSLKLSDDKFSFFVEDHVTGEKRPINTLSGGETFLASFSLALALSRHIQTMKARPIHFFFIDEGFGTLDDETLGAVTGVMDRLRSSDILVGFITHRKELRELVSNRILVTKSATGGSMLRLR